MKWGHSKRSLNLGICVYWKNKRITCEFPLFPRVQGDRALVKRRLHIHIEDLGDYSGRVPDALTAAFLQLPWALGDPDAATGSFRTGLLCTLLASPGAQLLSLLLRLSQVPTACPHALLSRVLPHSGTPAPNNHLPSAGSQQSFPRAAPPAPKKSARGDSSG